jgi:putative heme-binding domain-containing protein
MRDRVPLRRLALLGALFLAAPAFATLRGVVLAEEPEADQAAGKPDAPRVFLDKSPRVVAYQLARLTNEELVRVERRTDHPKYRPVYEALLARGGLEVKYRSEAIEALAVLNKTERTAEILAAVERLDAGAEEPGDVIHDLVHALAMAGKESLLRERGRLEGLARGAAKGVCREIGYAGLVLAERSADAAWALAAERPGGIVDLLRALPMIHDGDLLSSFYPRVRPLLEAAGDAETLRAAIESLPAIPGHDAESFARLAAFIRRGSERPSAVRAIRRLPAAAWPPGEIPPLAAAVLEWVEGTPPGERTAPALLDAAELGRELAAKLPPAEGARLRTALNALGVRVILVRTVPHAMRYDRSFFAVGAGKPVEIALENPDIMPHNLVIGVPGSLREIGTLAETMAPDPDPGAKQFVPASDQVLHATHLLQPEGRATLSFVAPAEPGDYPYVCTFPGHWTRMYGVMLVVADLEAWEADPVEPADPLGKTRKLVKEWALEDLAADLPGLGQGRDRENGRTVFTEAGCAGCHKLGAEGGAVGPELTEVFKKWKGQREDVLREILTPAKVVEEKYRARFLQLEDGTSIYGLVVEESDAAVTIVVNPERPLPRSVPRSAIVLETKTEGSLMPEGLLNHFTREEILDLLAFLEGAGAAGSGERR